MTNVFDPRWDEEGPGGSKRARLGRQVGTKQIGLSLYELPAGAGPFPYHYQHGNEELLIVLQGRPHLRTPDGWRQLAEGDTASFPSGADGAHEVANRTDEPVRYLMLSEMNAPDVMVYPDSNKVGVISRPPGSPGDEHELAAWFRLDDQVDYWEGERPLDPPQ
jgi:uncharacterized cupin superfamily protein